MASRKEQKEALRREREERESKARTEQRRKQVVGYGVAGAIALVAIVVIGALVLGGGGDGESSASSEAVYPSGGSVPVQKLTDLNEAAADAGCTLKSDRNDSAKHTSSLNQRVKYRTNPPTSGEHYVQPPTDGAYAEPLQDEQFVHSMEHGRIVIWFKPTLPAKDRADLKALFDEDNYQMVLTPRAKMPYEVAVTAWNASPGKEGTGRLMLCEKFERPQVFDAIRSFRDEHRGNGPEPVP